MKKKTCGQGGGFAVARDLSTEEVGEAAHGDGEIRRENSERGRDAHRGGEASASRRCVSRRVGLGGIWRENKTTIPQRRWKPKREVNGDGREKEEDEDGGRCR